VCRVDWRIEVVSVVADIEFWLCHLMCGKAMPFRDDGSCFWRLRLP
jgi:hypothetical protein